MRGTPHRLISSYLSNRSQFVRIGSSFSNTNLIELGVPQGTILGPILFLIYINDLAHISPLITSVLFADDTTLLFRHSSFHQLESICNSEFEKFRKWSICNRLSLNLDKSYVFFVSNRTTNRDPCIYFDNVPLAVVPSCTFLGVKIDNDLKFKSHIDHVCLKVAKSFGVLYKISYLIPDHIRRNLYFSFIHPYLAYCVCVWSNTSRTLLKPAITIQKRSVRAIYHTEYLAHTGPIFLEHNLLKFIDIKRYFIACHVFKNYNNFPLSSSQHNHITRAFSDLLVPRTRTVLADNSIYVSGPTVWNNLPESLKSIPSMRLSLFKKQLKTYLIHDY